jgi:hypothetical protein
VKASASLTEFFQTYVNSLIFVCTKFQRDEEARMTALFFGNTRFELGALIITPRVMRTVTLHEFNSAL